MRNRANKPRFQSEFTKNGTDLANGNSRFLHFQVNQVVIAIDFVTQSRNGFELMVELENFVQITKPGRINFQFEHARELRSRKTRTQNEFASEMHPVRLHAALLCDKGSLSLNEPRTFSFFQRCPCSPRFFSSGCESTGVSEGIQRRELTLPREFKAKRRAIITSGGVISNRNYKFWGYVRRPGQPWSTSQLVMLNEKQKLAPDRAQNNIGSDNNYEYKLYGVFSGDNVYEPASNGMYPEFVLKNYELVSPNPPPIFKSQYSGRAQAATGV